jgi:hypothetical protein
MPVIIVLRRLRQEDSKLLANLCYKSKNHLKKTKIERKKINEKETEATLKKHISQKKKKAYLSGFPWTPRNIRNSKVCIQRGGP